MRHAQRDQRGFTLIEIMMVIAILATVAGIAAGVSPAMIREAKADSSIEQAVDVFRSAREVAISQRRNVMIQFLGNNALRTVRQNIPGPGTTILRTVQLENRMQFMKTPGLPDTPDLFGNAQAVNFGPTAQWMFTSEGTFVDNSGDILNGTLFLGIPDQINSARAVSVFGATALIRVWSWNGREWVQ
jgi:prepilin-type N-terminal cleavage/methylation domain-containing protein